MTMELCSRKLRSVGRELRLTFQQFPTALQAGLLGAFVVGLMFLTSGQKSTTVDLNSTVVDTDDYPKVKNHIELRIVSMNIALLEASKVAPAAWTAEDQTEALLQILLASDPHVIALQECPSAGWIYNSFPDYRVIGEKKSHSGFTTFLVKRDTLKTMEQGDLKGSDYPMVSAGIPAVMGVSSDLAVASVHLEPFDEGYLKRRDQMDAIIKASSRKGLPLIIVGDMNMRESEDNFAEHSLGLTDAWKANGLNNNAWYTWDTTKHDNGFFNEFYGKSTRQVQRRYDRVYIHGVRDVVVSSFQLLANAPIGESQNHFLSDHFGLATTLALN